MKRLAFVFFLFLLLPLVVAAPPFPTQTISSQLGLEVVGVDFDSIAFNTSRQAVAQVLNASNGLPLTSGVSCVFRIYSVSTNGNIVYTNTTPTISGIDYIFAIPNTVYSNKGEYSRVIYCNTSIVGGVYKNSFYVTKSGGDPAPDIFMVMIWLLFILSTVGLFYTLFLNVAKLATAETTIYDVLVSWAFYILTLIVNYLGQEYLLRTFVEDLTGTFLTVTVWTNGVLPLIAFIITFFIKGTQKKKVLSVQEVSGFRYG